jgi:peptidyl-prolyl cis-trans isomerase SurA
MIMSSLRKILVFGILVFTAFELSAQDKRPLVTIAGEDVSVDEFMYVYKKNNTQENLTDKKSIEEYLDLYINFKLKVKEAEALGYDTVSAFKKELAGYREQLAEPYFVNEDITEALLAEAYERYKEDIRASHILIKVGPAAMPADTLMAYNKIIAAKTRIDKGEAFEKVAKDVSEDPSARDRVSQKNKTMPGNGGDLGYFTVFDMVYPFECGAYRTEVGKVSLPVRSDFGYHLIKVTDRIPAQGSIEGAHLYLQMPENATHDDSVKIQLRIDSLYQRIQNGESYEDLVKQYSDDKGSAQRGGMLPKFNVNRMVPEFIQAISSMSDSGDISKPVQTLYGWHIIKLYSKTGIKSFEEEKENLSKRLKKDSRAQKSNEAIINGIKKEYGFKVNEKGLNKMYSIFDSTIYEGKWAVPASETLNSAVFTLDKQPYTQKQFAEFIASDQNIAKEESINEFVNKKFTAFTDKECKAYEDKHLEQKYPEFKAIMKEYRDGILLFELTNDKIWTFATKDTTGLKNYYAQHSSDFMWDTRLDASIYTFSDTSVVGMARKMVIEGKTDDEVLKAINNDSLNILKIERKKFQEKDNGLIDSIKWKKGISDNKIEKGKTVFVVVHDKVEPEPKTFDEARGLITAGYQEYLEKEWIKELKAKYPVMVHEDVLITLTKK